MGHSLREAELELRAGAPAPPAGGGEGGRAGCGGVEGEVPALSVEGGVALAGEDRLVFDADPDAVRDEPAHLARKASLDNDRR